MAQVTYNPTYRPSMCESPPDPPIAQLATAIGDLQDDFHLIEALSNFIQEELAPADNTNWPKMRSYLLALALDHRVERFRMNLGAVAELAQETAR